MTMEEISGLLEQSKDLYNYLVREIEETDTTILTENRGIKQNTRYQLTSSYGQGDSDIGDSGNKVVTCIS